ncbi:hypothetical protein BDL97_16G074000 [Sphagnum fallax]|nr:hypothetical protein BDL97_16G074000 [Sphagnum fallax]
MEHKTLSHLPNEVLENIFVRLPLKYIVRLRCLSRYWRSTLFSNRFQKLNAALPTPRIAIFKVRTLCRLRSANVSRIFQVCVYDVSAKEWCKIPIHGTPPLNLEAILHVDGGIICWKAFHQIHQDRFSVCNPVMGIWRELPPLLDGSEFHTLEKMVCDTDTGTYKLQLRTSGCNCRRGSGCTNSHDSVKIFDSSIGSWSIGDLNALEVPQSQSTRRQVQDANRERIDFIAHKNYFYVHDEIFMILTVFEPPDSPDLKQVRVLTFQTSTQTWDERWPQELASYKLKHWDFEDDLMFEPSFSAIP